MADDKSYGNMSEIFTYLYFVGVNSAHNILINILYVYLVRVMLG